MIRKKEPDVFEILSKTLKLNISENTFGRLVRFCITPSNYGALQKGTTRYHCENPLQKWGKLR